MNVIDAVYLETVRAAVGKGNEWNTLNTTAEFIDVLE